MKNRIKAYSLILTLVICISLFAPASQFKIKAEASTLKHFVLADASGTTTNFISRSPVALDRAPTGQAYLYTASDNANTWFNYGFKGINNLDNNAEAVAFWVGQDKTADGEFFSANYKLNFIGISANRKNTLNDFYFIPTDGGEISTSRSGYIYSIFDSNRKHGDFIEGWVVIPLSMYDDSTKKALVEKENLEIHITTNVNKSYISSDGTVTNGTATKKQNHYISSLGFVTDLDGFLAQFVDGYSDESIYKNNDSNSIYNGLTADMYLHFKAKENKIFDKDYDLNNKLSRINGAEALWNKNSTFSYSPFYSISANDIKNGKLNQSFKIGARKSENLSGLTRETLIGFKAPTITFWKNGLLLCWEKINSADRYEISVFDSKGLQVKTVSTDTNSAPITGLILNNTYTFQIDAYNLTEYIGSSACRTYDYVAHSIFDGSITEGFGGNSSTEVEYPSSPTKKAVMLEGSGTVWQKSNLKSDEGIEAIAVWVAQSGRRLGNDTYYEQKMIALNINGNTVYGNSAGSAVSVNYIIPTFGNTAYAVPSSKKMAMNIPSKPLSDNAGCYYVFSLDSLSASDREYINNILKNGQELRVTTMFGTNVSYYKAGSKSYVSDSSLIKELAALENKYYHSNVLLISDLEKYLENNGITAVETSNSIIDTGDRYSSAENDAGEFIDYSDCTFVGSKTENGKTTANFEDKTGLTDIKYSVTLPSANNAKNCGIIDAELSSKGGLSFIFTANKTGMYYLSSSLELVSGNTAKWRVIVDSNGKNVHKKGTVYNGDSSSFGKGIYSLKAGDRLLIEVYTEDIANVKIMSPLVTLIPISVKSDKIEYKYYYNAFNLSAAYGLNSFETDYIIGNSNPWNAYALDQKNVKHSLNTLGTTTADDNANIISSATCDTAFIQPSVYSAGEYMARSVISSSSVISYEFRSPSTGSLSLGGIEAVEGLSYCTVVNGKADDFKKCDTNEITVDLPYVKTGDKIEIRLKNNLSSSIYVPCNLYAKLKVNEIIYGDTNADGLFTLKDLVHTKKYYSGIISDLNNSGAIGNFTDENHAQLLSFMRNALLGGSNIADFILKSE